MDNYKVTLLKGGVAYNITPLVGNMSWKDSIDTLGMELTLDFARNVEDRYTINWDVVEIKNFIVVTNNNLEIFRGIITDVNWDRFSKSITAFDFAIYLNKTKIIKQCNKESGSTIIKKICQEYGFPVGIITNIPTQIKKIYSNETIADIIKDILKQSTDELGVKYRLEFRAGKLYIENYYDLILDNITFQPASNIDNINILDAIGSISRTQSIQEIKNRVIVVSGGEKSVKVHAKAEDTKSIAEIGLFTEIESVDDKDSSKAQNIAKNKLKELNKITEDIKLDLLGNDIVRAGRIINLNNNIFKLNGKYLIKDCTHTVNNNIHKMQLGLEVAP